MTTYAERLKSLMDAKGVTTTKLAQELGITYQAVNKVLKLGGEFGSENNLAAAAYFGVSPIWLASNVGSPDGKPQMVNVVLDAAYTPTAEAVRLGKLLDMIPEDDLIRRSRAYGAATRAIVDVIEGHTQQPTAQPTPDQKTQPA